MGFFNLLWKDGKEHFCKKEIWLFFTIVSVIIIAGTYCAVKEKSTRADALVSIGVVDQDQSPYSKMLIDFFQDSEEVAEYAEIVSGNEAEIKLLFEQKKIIGYLIIPEQFVQNLISLQNIPIQVVMGTDNTTIAVVFNNILKSYEKYISSVEVNCAGLYQMMTYEHRTQELIEKKNMEISMQLIFLALGRKDLFEVHEIENAGQVSMKQHYMQSLVVLVFLFGSVFGGFSYLREKENQTLARLHLVGISEGRYLFYKAAMLCVGGSVLIFLLYSVALKTAKIPVNMEGYLKYIACMCGCILLSLAFAYVCKTKKTYLLVTGTIYFMFYIVGGGIIPMMYMPRILYQIGKYSPVYHMLRFLE